MSDWFLREWVALRSKKQADLVTELGWHSTTAHRLWHGRQLYRRDFLNEAARWLDVAPFRLMDLRSFRQSKGLTLAQAAAELGLKSRGQLHDLESGRAKASIRTASKIHQWSAGAVPIDKLCPEAAGLLRQLAGAAA